MSVSSLGTVACTGTVCFSNLFSTPTFTANANAGWHFTQWTGCSAAGTNATEFGRIYTVPNGKTTEIHGALYAAWRTDPYSNPSNSYPTGDETATPTGGRIRSGANNSASATPPGASRRGLTSLMTTARTAPGASQTR